MIRREMYKETEGNEIVDIYGSFLTRVINGKNIAEWKAE